jgi:hypothetical protein
MPAAFDRTGDLVRIEFGRHTDWALIAEYVLESGTRWIVVGDPVSFRVHDEREIQPYWEQRAAEGAPIAMAYEIEQSAYLDELRQGVSAMMEMPLRHFLIGGANTCLEIISSEPPVVGAEPPAPDRPARS